MALQLNTQFQGISVPSAYCLVGGVCFPGNSKTGMAFALYYKTGAATEVAFMEQHFEAPYNIEGADPYKQAYEYLKTLPEFAEAQDC